MFKSRKLRCAVLIISTLGPIPPMAIGSGFPVVDIAGLAQALQQYIQIMQQYDEMLTQTGLNQDQLLSALQQYQQALTEYQHLLRQAERLKNQLDKKEWDKFYRTVNRMYDSRPFEGFDVRTATGGLVGNPQKEADARYGEVSRNHEQYEDLATNTIGGLPDTLNRSYQRTNQGIEQRATVNHYRNENVNHRQKIQSIDDQRQSLGDESELATLQLIADQNQVLIDSIAQLNEITLAQYEYSNGGENTLNVNLHNIEVRRLQKAQQALDNPINIDNQPMRP